jgi:hypothetical protein
MLWLALYFPQFALDCALRHHAGLSAQQPVVLVAQEAGAHPRPYLYAVNAAAQRQALKVGQSLAQAQALVAEFLALPRALSAEQNLQTLLLDWAYGVCRWRTQHHLGN